MPNELRGYHGAYTSNKADMVGIFDEFPTEAIQLPIHCKFVLFVCCCFQLEMSELLTPTKI